MCCWLLFFIFLMFFDCFYLIVCKTLSKTNVFRRQTSENQKTKSRTNVFNSQTSEKQKTLSKSNVFHCQTSEKLKNIKQNQSQTSEKQWQTKKDLEKKTRKKDQKRRQGMEGAGECGWEGEGTRSCIFVFVVHIFFLVFQ